MTLKDIHERLTPNALWLYLWLVFNADGDGVLEMSLRDISRNTKLTLQEVRSAMRSCVDNTLVNTSRNTRGNTSNTLVVSKLDEVCDQDATQGLTQHSTQAKEEIPQTPIEESLPIKKNISMRDKKESSPKASLYDTFKKTDRLEDKQKAFYDLLVPYVEKYDKGMIRAFYDYWSAQVLNRPTMMLCEVQQSWSTSGRLATWKRNEYNKPQGAGSTGVVWHAEDENEETGYETW